MAGHSSSRADDSEAKAVMRDLDAADPSAGNEWSVRFARAHGWGDEEIEHFLFDR